MFKFDNRLVFFIAMLGLLSLVLSCSQADDIVASKSVTKIWLDAERLPEAPDGMIYELWVSKADPSEDVPLDDARSLGRFGYLSSDSLVAFLNVAGEVRPDSNFFMLAGDIFDYEYLFVGVQNLDSINEVPKSVMLINPISGNSDTLRMYFPMHDVLFDAVMRCNFETPTDGNSGNDGYGLWFSSYNHIDEQWHDTLGVAISYVDSTIEPIYDADSNIQNLPTLYAAYPDFVGATFHTTLLDFGRDTLALELEPTPPDTTVDSTVDSTVLAGGHLHHGATQYVIRTIDSVYPRTIKDFTILWNTVAASVSLDIFTQDAFALPDLSGYGWEYKGWVISDDIPPTAIGEFTPPAWDFISGELMIPGYSGGLISTGTFTDVTSADDANPFTGVIEWDVDSIGSIAASDSTTYIWIYDSTGLHDSVFGTVDSVWTWMGWVYDSTGLYDSTVGSVDSAMVDSVWMDTVLFRDMVLKRPNFPGEDFLDSLALYDATNGVIDWGPLNLFPSLDTYRRASVFVSIEPINRTSDSTNFPLIAFGRAFPGGTGDYRPPYGYTLFNWTGSADGANGFPKLTARISRL